jgi:transposase
MFWGAFSYGNRTNLIELDGDPLSPRQGVTGRQILETLQEALPTIVLPGHSFIQDNAPVHRARVVQGWLQEWARDNGLDLVDWPPYSPDLNPIENVWKILKFRVCERYPELGDLPKTQAALQRLIQAAEEVWEEVEVALLDRLAEGMPRRLQAVIQAGGWYTKY